ncbi:MAG: hypothetical protein IKU52_06385 [Clostridia bacterium]|nr:hypothetical protein [Clostridia bacterium]
MDKNIEFRKQMRGYNTDDVNRFISEENVRFNNIEEGYKKSIDEKTKMISELEMKLNSLKDNESEIQDLKIRNELLHSEIDSLNDKLKEKDVIIESLKDALDKANDRIVDLERDSKKRVITAVDPDIEIYREKAEKFDAIYAQVDDILEFAKEEAQKILKEATEYKAVVQRNAKKETDIFKSSINNRSDSIIEDLKRTFRKQIKGK